MANRPTSPMSETKIADWANALDPVEVPLGRTGAVTLVDAVDIPLIANRSWSLTNGYATAHCRLSDPEPRKTLYLHRVLLDAPDRIFVDHINGSKLDNRRCNLRLATNSQNLANMGPRSDNASGYRGVMWRAEKGRWYAQIGGRAQKYIGYFDTAEEAARAWDAAARELWGEFAFQNFAEQAAA